MKAYLTPTPKFMNMLRNFMLVSSYVEGLEYKLNYNRALDFVQNALVFR